MPKKPRMHTAERFRLDLEPEGFYLGLSRKTVRAAWQSTQKRFTLPCGQPLQSTQLRFTLPCGQGLQTAQLYFSLPCGQPVQSAQLPLSLPCGHPLQSTQSPFRLLCGQPLQSAQLRLSLPCGQGLQSEQCCFRLPCGQALQSLQPCFSFPCGHGLQSAQLYFTLPCGHGLHTLQCVFCLPCRHRLFLPIARSRPPTRAAVCPRARDREGVVAFRPLPELKRRVWRFRSMVRLPFAASSKKNAFWAPPRALPPHRDDASAVPSDASAISSTRFSHPRRTHRHVGRPRRRRAG